MKGERRVKLDQSGWANTGHNPPNNYLHIQT